MIFLTANNKGERIARMTANEYAELPETMKGSQGGHAAVRMPGEKELTPVEIAESGAVLAKEEIRFQR